MQKSQLLGVVSILGLFAIISSANAALIASDDTTITSTDQASAQTFAVSPSSFPGVALTLNVPGESGQPRADENFNYFIDGTSAESPHTDSPVNLRLLLLAAAVFGIFSEIFNRRSFHRKI